MWRDVQSFRHITGIGQTDGQTDRQSNGRPLKAKVTRVLIDKMASYYPGGYEW